MTIEELLSDWFMRQSVVFDFASRTVQCGYWLSRFPEKYQDAVADVIIEVSGKYINAGIVLKGDPLAAYRAELRQGILDLIDTGVIHG